MTSDLHQRIERRAYALWEHAGRPDGGAEHYWLAAEAELEGEAHSGGGIPVTDEQEGPDEGSPEPRAKPPRKR